MYTQIWNDWCHFILFFLFLFRFWHTRIPSSGMMVFTAAVTFCNKISLYGFYPFYTDRYNNSVKYHYYDDKYLNMKTNVHKMPREFRQLVNLHDNGVIRLVTDKCEQKLVDDDFTTISAITCPMSRNTSCQDTWPLKTIISNKHRKNFASLFYSNGATLRCTIPVKLHGRVQVIISYAF